MQFQYGDVMEVDHIIPRVTGGKDVYTNLQLLHRHCHQLKSLEDGSIIHKAPKQPKEEKKPSKEDWEKKFQSIRP